MSNLPSKRGHEASESQQDENKGGTNGSHNYVFNVHQLNAANAIAPPTRTAARSSATT